MKFEVSNTSTARGGRESKEVRNARMRGFFAQAINAVLIPVGKLLSAFHDTEKDADGKPVLCATMIASGKPVVIDNIGPFIVASAYSVLSLSKLQWLCPACHSAHGSGLGVSDAVSAKLLAGNRFYFRPADGALISISKTCYDEYVTGLGFAPRFTSAVDYAAIQEAKAALVAAGIPPAIAGSSAAVVAGKKPAKA